MPKNSPKTFVNSQSYIDKETAKRLWFCGYKVGNKYFEQEERFNNEKEALKALEN